MKKYYSIVFVLITISLQFRISDCYSQWQQTNGPCSEVVRCFAVNGTNIYAGTNYGGIYFSTNNGFTWSKTNSTVSIYADIKALVINGANVFAGTNGSGVFMSTNNGANWTAVNTGLNLNVRALTVSGNKIFAGTSVGVFVSNNNGNSWTNVTTGIINSYVSALFVNGTNIFAGTGDGIFLSTNNGVNWTSANTGLPLFSSVNSFAVNGSEVFAGVSGSGVYKSANNGVSWTAVNTGLPNLNVVALAATNNNIFAGTYNSGIYMSSNSGASWNSSNTGLINSNILSIAVCGNDILTGTNGNGAFVTHDSGISWIETNTGLTSSMVYALDVNGSNIYTQTTGFYKSGDNGGSWNPIMLGVQPLPSAIAIRDSNIFIGTYSEGVFLSTNNGISWTDINTGLLNFNIRAIAIYGNNIFAGTAGGGIFLSNDNGANWVAVNNGLVTNTIVSAFGKCGNRIFAFVDCEGVFISDNNGSSWSFLNTGITGNIMAFAAIGSNIFAGTDAQGVFVSTNNGTNWTSVNNGLINLSVTTLATSGIDIIAGTDGNGVFRSSNNGSNWFEMNAGLTANDINKLVINETNIFAGTSGDGLWTLTLSQLENTAENSFAGNDTICCGLFLMGGMHASTPPSGYNGQWSTVTTPGASCTPQFISPGNPNTGIYVPCYGVYTFVWRISNGINTTTDTVMVEFMNPPNINAGSDQWVCGERVQLNATTGGGAAGSTWINAPVSWINPNSLQYDSTQITNPNAIAEHLHSINDTVSFVWSSWSLSTLPTISPGLQCRSNDTIVVRFYVDYPAIVTTDTTLIIVQIGNQYCELHAILPPQGLGYWIDNTITTVFSPDATSPDVCITVNNNTYHELHWVVINGMAPNSSAVCIDTSDAIKINFLNPLEIEKNNLEDFNFSPDPVENIIRFNSDQNLIIDLINIYGQKIKTIDLLQKTSFDFSDISAGVYFLQAKMNDKIIIKKMIKQ